MFQSVDCRIVWSRRNVITITKYYQWLSLTHAESPKLSKSLRILVRESVRLINLTIGSQNRFSKFPTPTVTHVTRVNTAGQGAAAIRAITFHTKLRYFGIFGWKAHCWMCWNNICGSMSFQPKPSTCCLQFEAMNPGPPNSTHGKTRKYFSPFGALSCGSLSGFEHAQERRRSAHRKSICAQPKRKDWNTESMPKYREVPENIWPMCTIWKFRWLSASALGCGAHLLWLHSTLPLSASCQHAAGSGYSKDSNDPRKTETAGKHS